MTIAILAGLAGVLALGCLVLGARLQQARDQLDLMLDDAWADAHDLLTTDDGGEEDQR